MQQQESTEKHFNCAQLLRRHVIFGRIGGVNLNRLCGLAIIRNVAAGRVIFARGDAATAMFGICAGAVTFAAPSMEPGAPAPELLQAGQLFGERALLAGEPRAADAVAVRDCELMVIKRRDFHALLLGNPKLAIKFTELLAAQLTLANERIEEATHLTVPTRVARALLRLAKEAGADGGKVAFTQYELARTVRSSRESVNKCLRSWMRRKLVRLERGGTTLIDRAALGIIARGHDFDGRAPSARRPVHRQLPM